MAARLASSASFFSFLALAMLRLSSASSAMTRKLVAVRTWGPNGEQQINIGPGFYTLDRHTVGDAQGLPLHSGSTQGRHRERHIYFQPSTLTQNAAAASTPA